MRTANPAIQSKTRVSVQQVPDDEQVQQTKICPLALIAERGSRGRVSRKPLRSRWWHGAAWGERDHNTPRLAARRRVALAAPRHASLLLATATPWRCASRPRGAPAAHHTFPTTFAPNKRGRACHTFTCFTVTCTSSHISTLFTPTQTLVCALGWKAAARSPLEIRSGSYPTLVGGGGGPRHPRRPHHPRHAPACTDCAQSA